MALRIVLALILLLAGLGVGTTESAYAQADIDVAAEYDLFPYRISALNDAMIYGRKTLCPPDEFDGVIFGKLVNCLTQPGEIGTGSVQKAGILVGITNVLIHRMQPFFAAIVFTVCTIVVAVYGAKLATGGVSNIKGETMTLVLKLAVVIAFTTQMDEFYNMLVTLMHAMSDMTYSALASGGSSARMCPGFVRPMLSGLGMTLGTDLWSEWDCVFGLMFFASGPIGGIGIIAGIFAMMVATMGTALFVFLFFLGIAAMLLKIAMMAIQTFLLAFMNMTFLMLLSPLFVMQIFFKSRKDSFEKWVTLLMESILTPAVLIAALTIMMAILKNVFIYGFLASTLGLGLGSAADFAASASRASATVSDVDVVSTTSYADPSVASTDALSRDGSSLPENLTDICRNNGSAYLQWCAPCGGGIPGYCPRSDIASGQGGLSQGTALCAGTTTTNPNPAKCEQCPGGDPTSWCPKMGDPSAFQDGVGSTGINTQNLANAAGASDEKSWGYGSFISGIITVVILMTTGAILKRIPEVAGGLASTGINFATEPVAGEKFFNRAKALVEEGAKAYATGGTSAAAKVGEKGKDALARDGVGGVAGDIAANIINQRAKLPR